MFPNVPDFDAKSRHLMDRLNVDVAIESVQDNPMLPESWNRPEYHHYQIVLMRSGRPELHFPITFPIQIDDGALPQAATPEALFRPSGEFVLWVIAEEMNYYEQHQTVEAWAADRNMIVTPDLVEKFPTFATERRSLMQFFGEHYTDFLAITDIVI